MRFSKSMDKEPGPEKRPKLTLAYARNDTDGLVKQQPERATSIRAQLEYLADTIRHMQVLAWQTGCTRVADLLEDAYREVDRERRARPKRLSWLEPV